MSSSDDDVSSAESSEADIDAVFNYRIAALNNANASQSCMGLAIQWLRLRDEGRRVTEWRRWILTMLRTSRTNTKMQQVQ
ncbi:hypothetical protein HXV84_00345 [Pseudomonas amygdali pv. morsprunorum]|nr:hypothetical protein [Pseudomonas amygdali pv. morsprunorum]